MELNSDFLKKLPFFHDLPDIEIDWLLQHGKILEITKNEKLFSLGDSTDDMFVILKGKIQVMLNYSGQLLPVAIHEPGTVTGLLPFSRMKKAPGNGTALEDATVLLVHRNVFPSMEKECPMLVQKCIELMKNRMREGERRQQQQEKLQALGKLSAGIAHEINNPASAIRRFTDLLDRQLGYLQEETINVMGLVNNGAILREAYNLLTQNASSVEKQTLSILERSGLEDEIGFWLEGHGMKDSLELSEDLVDMGVTEDDLEEVKATLKEKEIIPALRWIVAAYGAKKITADISESSKRIVDLVGSIKSYSHMDRANELEIVDIREGINSTIAMMHHKMKQKNISLKVSYPNDMPTIKGRVGELNQIWTNLIDNAIDALTTNGELRIVAEKQGDFIITDVIDNGSGIPEDIQSKIFDPFFTTKGVGKGTGLGLDIVFRIVKTHNGSIKVTSEEGLTKFSVCFPIA